MRRTAIATGSALVLSLVYVSISMAAFMVGRPEADEIRGTQRGDTIRGLEGDDQIWGRGGKDFVYAGSGADIVIGNYGNDWLYGKSGNDTIIGLAGADRLFGNTGDDTLWVTGDGKADIVRCGAGNDTVYFDATDQVADTCENKIGPIATQP
jgi:Ca2+-binding RTX toxin-like protein